MTWTAKWQIAWELPPWVSAILSGGARTSHAQEHTHVHVPVHLPVYQLHARARAAEKGHLSAPVPDTHFQTLRTWLSIAINSALPRFCSPSGLALNMV